MLTSTICWSLMVALLVYVSITVGYVSVLKLYVVPYWVSLEDFHNQVAYFSLNLLGVPL